MLNPQSLLVLASVYSALVSGIPTSPFGNLVEHERAASLPSSWKTIRDVDGAHNLNLKIALRQHEHLSEKFILARSDPNSPEYGKYLSAQDVKRLTLSKRSTESSEAVFSWLNLHNATVTKASDSFIDFSVPASKANAMLDTTFSYFSNSHFKDQTATPRTQAYSIPESLKSHIDFIHPTVHFMSFRQSEPTRTEPLNKRQHGLPTGPVTCQDNICPSNLTARYNITYSPPDDCTINFGVASFLEQYPSHEDLTIFLTNFTNPFNTPKATSPNDLYKIESVNGGSLSDASSTSTLEALLDLDYTTPFLPNVNITYYQTGGRAPAYTQPGNKAIPTNDTSTNQNEPFLELFDYLINHPSPPSVISMSYSDDEQSVPEPYARKVCDQLATLAARGVTVVGASGDGGAQGTGFSDCTGPNGQKRFIPTFPSSCPWITSVGALALYGGPASYSSGGLSNYFPTPSWQVNDVATYVKSLNDTPPSYYNASGRGYPDVSLFGDSYVVVQGGYAQTAKGSSASTPVFASIVALLNDLRVRAGKPTLGFLNKALYDAARGALRDVDAIGNINGCSGADSEDIVVGYGTIPGWDAASGLGEPDFNKLREIFV